MKQQLNEVQKLQKIAGVIKEVITPKSAMRVGWSLASGGTPDGVDLEEFKQMQSEFIMWCKNWYEKGNPLSQLKLSPWYKACEGYWKVSTNKSSGFFNEGLAAYVIIDVAKRFKNKK